MKKTLSFTTMKRDVFWLHLEIPIEFWTFFFVRSHRLLLLDNSINLCHLTSGSRNFPHISLRLHRNSFKSINLNSHLSCSTNKWWRRLLASVPLPHHLHASSHAFAGKNDSHRRNWFNSWNLSHVRQIFENEIAYQTFRWCHTFTHSFVVLFFFSLF